MNDGIAIIDWSLNGHHAPFLEAFASGAYAAGIDPVIFCPSASSLKARLTRSTWVLSDIPQVFDVRRPSGSANGFLKKIRRGVKERAVASRIREQILGYLRTRGIKVGGLFFACMMENDESIIRAVVKHVGLPWGGVYLQPTCAGGSTGDLAGPYRLETSLQNYLCRTVGVFSSVHESGLKSRLLDKEILRLPEIPNPLPQSVGEHPVYLKIRDFVRDRFAIGCFGFLKKSKGILELVRMLRSRACAGNLCAIIIGEVEWGSFSAEEEAELRRAFVESRSILALPVALPNDTDLSAAITAIDAIYAVYRDFPFSSNMISQAAACGKPILVADGYEMADRVREFGLGLVVNQGDETSLKMAFDKIMRGDFHFSEKRIEYLEMNGRQKFIEVCASLFNSVLYGRARR